MFGVLNNLIKNIEIYDSFRMLAMVLAAALVMTGSRADAASKLVGEEMHRWDVESQDIGGTLLFSDSPEYVTEDGILYSDTVQGEARILFYHLNETNSPKKLAVVLENKNGNIIKVHVSRGHTSAPNRDYMTVGKETQLAYFGKKLDKNITLLPNGGRQLLDGIMDRQILWSGQLVYGVYDFYSEEPVKVTVVMCPSGDNPVQFIRHAKQLPKDEQMLRGTFQGMNRIVTSRQVYDPSKNGAVYIPVCDNYHDNYMVGIDVTDGSKAVNYGNYGVLYKFNLPTVGQGLTQYYLNPLGGMYAGAMTVRMNDSEKSTLLPTPRNRIYFGDSTLPESDEEMRQWQEEGVDYIKADTELEDLGKYNNSEELTFEFSPPGASNLPVNLILMPVR